MPNVLASSGIIGTKRGATFLSLNKLVNILTKTIVVDISFSPVDFINVSKISFGGALIDLANELTELLKPYDFLATPIVENNCTHVYYHYPIRYIESEIGIPRSVFMKALKAEGISVTESLNTPLYFEPIFKDKRAHAYKYLNLLNRKVDYPKGLCKVAERIMIEEVFITDICKYPNTSKEIKEFVMAVEKITKNISVLRGLNE